MTLLLSGSHQVLMLFDLSKSVIPASSTKYRTPPPPLLPLYSSGNVCTVNRFSEGVLRPQDCGMWVQYVTVCTNPHLVPRYTRVKLADTAQKIEMIITGCRGIHIPHFNLDMICHLALIEVHDVVWRYRHQLPEG